MYDAEDVLDLLNYYDLDLILNHLVGIRRQSVLQEAE
jgi:hypothetical protein